MLPRERNLESGLPAGVDFVDFLSGRDCPRCRWSAPDGGMVSLPIWPCREHRGWRHVAGAWCLVLSGMMLVAGFICLAQVEPGPQANQTPYFIPALILLTGWLLPMFVGQLWVQSYPLTGRRHDVEDVTARFTQVLGIRR